MTKNNGTLLSRRDVIRLTAAGAAAAIGTVLPPVAARADAPRRTLRIAQWDHFVPEYDEWFDNEYATEWGRQNGVKVIVDHIAANDIPALAASEVKAGQGHDLFMFPSPPATYERHVIDHNDVYEAVGRKHGVICPLGHKSTFNPTTKKYFAFADSFLPAPLLYLENYWKKINIPLGPTSYAEMLEGAIDIRKRFGVPCGLELTPGLASNMALHAIFSTFGANVQDEHGQVTINADKRTGYAMQFVKSLYDLGGSTKMLTGSPGDGVDAMLAQQSSCTINSIALIRKAEREKPEVARAIQLRPSLRTPHRQVGYPHVTSCYVIWEFAKNKDDAKQFLTDWIGSSHTAFEKSKYCSFSCFPRMLPDLVKRLENDPTADPPFKYLQLEDALFWTQNLGYPGYATAGFCEVFDSFVIPKTVARVVKGELSPEEGAAAAEGEVKQIYAKWA